MTTYQFSTEITRSGDLPVPPQYLDSIPSGSKVKVILVVESASLESTSNPDRVARADIQESSLEQLVASLRSRPLPDSIITLPTASLRDYLAESTGSVDPDFDEEKWNQQWDQIEVEMNAAEQADVEKTLNEMRQDLQT